MQSLDHGKLAKLVMMALAAGSDSEKISAIRLINAHLKAANLDAHYLASLVTSRAKPALSPVRKTDDNGAADADISTADCLEMTIFLRKSSGFMRRAAHKERTFVQNAHARAALGFGLTDKQKDWLRILSKQWGYAA